MKTKKQLLRVMRRMGACWPAILYVDSHPAALAEDVGWFTGYGRGYTSKVELTQWKIWFLTRRLTRAGLKAFSRRTGLPLESFFYHGDVSTDRSNLRQILWVEYTHDLLAEVDNCWRAWCRS